MAEFITPAEKTRRLIIVIVCVVLDTAFLAGGVYWFKLANDCQKGEKGIQIGKDLYDNIEKQQGDLARLDAENKAAQQSLVDFAQPIGWRSHASWTTDRLVTGSLNAEQLKQFLDTWAAELRAREPKEGEKESMKYAFLRQVKYLLNGSGRAVGFNGLENARAAAQQKAEAAAAEGEKKFWQNEAASLSACVESIKAAIKDVDQTAELPMWSARGGEGILLKRLFEELEKLENAYLGVAAALGKRLKEASSGEAEILKDARQQTEEAQKKLLKTIDDLIGADRASKTFTSKDLPGGILGDLRKSEQDGPKGVAEKKARLNEISDQVAEQERRLAQFKDENDLKIRELESRINWFKHRREEARERREPDGEIVGVVEGRELAYIDLLHKDRLFRGTKFRVYAPHKGGVKIDKGEVEVLEVREAGSSIVAVTRVMDPSDPIRPGDRIYNEVFEKGRPRYIAIAGRLSGRLSNEEAATLIRRFGDHYQDRVDRRTDFIVVGEGYAGPDGKPGTTDGDPVGEDDAPNFKLAREWGVRMILERTLYEYLGVK